MHKLNSKICLFLLFMSVSFSIGYWAIAKYDVTTDFSSSDAKQYIQMSRLNFEDVPRRFQYRILTPFMVYEVTKLGNSLHLPEFLEHYYENVEQKLPQLYFGIINIICLTWTAFIFFYYCRRLNFSNWESLVGSLLFLSSFFPVTYYSLPLVDSLSVLLLVAGFYAVLVNSSIGIFLSFLLGVFTKETIFVIPLLILLVDRTWKTKKLFACLPVVVIYALYVKFFPLKPANDGAYIFEVVSSFREMCRSFLLSLEAFNFYTLIEWIETYMVLWVLLVYALFRCQIPIFLKRALWLLVLPFILPFFQLVSANGRVAFYLFPIAIPLSLLALRDIFQNQCKSSGDLLGIKEK